MRVSAALLIAVSCGFGVTLVGCGSTTASSCKPSEARAPIPPPSVTLTEEEEDVWKPLPPDRSAVPVLLYHGIGPTSDFANTSDAAYGVDAPDFAKQLTMIKHAGYQTIDLSTFVAFVQGKQVDLPARPLLLTFDDGRADSWTGADSILKKLHFTAVMFVDTGRVDCDPEYLTWDELQRLERSGHWQLQLHAGPDGHQYIQYGPGKDETGPFYAYVEQHEDFEGWQTRVRSDIENGQKTLSEQISTYRPLAFAPPYGNYGQDGTNDPRIPGNLLGWLSERYDDVFTQDKNARARPGEAQPLGRIQVTRVTTGGAIHSALLTGMQGG